jgi:hypothetical protein
VFLEVLLGVFGLFDGVVTLPLLFLGRIAVIEGVVVVVRALQSTPVFETLAPFRWSEVAAALSIDVPLADPACFVTCVIETVGYAAVFGGEREIVQIETMGEWVFSRDKRRSVWTAYGDSGNRVGEVDALAG